MPILTPLDTKVGALEFRRGAWRRWDGLQWRLAEYSRAPARLRVDASLHDDPRMGEAERADALDRAVEADVLGGSRLVLRRDSSAIMGRRRSVSHASHAVMTLITGGLWAIVWIIASLNRREDRYRLAVDSWGNVWPLGEGRSR